jgi:hypothetical protein
MNHSVQKDIDARDATSRSERRGGRGAQSADLARKLRKTAPFENERSRFSGARAD